MTDETTTEQLAEIEGQQADTPATEYTPPEGWRVLAVGERLRAGDMIVRKDGSRYPAERFGGWVGSNQRHIRLIEPQPQPQPQPEPQPEQQAATIEELRSEVSYVQRLLGESRQRVRQLEELVASLRTINAAQEKTVRAAGQENTDLQHRLDVVSAEWAEQLETVRKLQIELDAAQQVPHAVSDRFEEGWDAGTARAVETIAEWLEPIRHLIDAADNMAETEQASNLAADIIRALPAIMRSLTGLTPED